MRKQAFENSSKQHKIDQIGESGLIQCWMGHQRRCCTWFKIVNVAWFPSLFFCDILSSYNNSMCTSNKPKFKGMVHVKSVIGEISSLWLKFRFWDILVSLSLSDFQIPRKPIQCFLFCYIYSCNIGNTLDYFLIILM